MSAVDLRKVLESIRELNMSGRDENGHRWANSDLIEQEAHAGLVALAEAAISPVSAGKVKALQFEGHNGFWRADDGIGGFFEVTEVGGAFHMCRVVHGHANKLIPYQSQKAAFAACQVEHDRRILAALQPGDGWLGIESAKLDRSQMIVAVPDQHRTGWIVGEAYYDPEAKDWFWAGTSANDYFGGPISELNHWLPELWQPMPEPSAPPAALPLGEETR